MLVQDDILGLLLDASGCVVTSDRMPLFGAARSFPLKSSRVDDLDINAVPFANRREFGRDAGQAHAKLLCNLFGVNLVNHVRALLQRHQ